jgi:hypothetical protein
MIRKMGQHNVILGVLAIALATAFLAGCVQSKGTTYYPPGEGRFVATIADAAADMGTVSSVSLRVDSVRVHSTTKGWVDVTASPQTFDLLQLKANGTQSLLADANLSIGAYDQVRLEVSNVTVIDSQGIHQAKLPSNELKVMGDFEVKANSTTAVNFDFIADQSLHVTGNGKYILAPVIQTESRSDADVVVNGKSDVRISGGSVKTRVKIGMDAEGNVGEGLSIPANAKLTN